MKHPDVREGRIPTEEIKLNRRELSARLKTARDFSDPMIDRCLERFLRTVDCRYAFVRLPVDFPEENICDFGFAKTESRDLYKNLYGCKEVFFLAVTVGLEVDRLLLRLSALGAAEHFITDAVGSAAAESLCEQAVEAIAKEFSCRPRFSPGYGDLPLDFQKPLLCRLDAYERLGITLNNALLMTPTKSITAVMGIEDRKDRA